ncbi:MAG: hypothetical protein JJT96_11680 [Opitutales bacterium]|nr:hypothetical protein [Opitutales bacterium]
MKSIAILHNEGSILSALSQWSQQTGEALPDLLVECGEQPLLAHILNLDTPPQYPGLRGALVDPDRWPELAISHENAPAPILLAPAQGIAPAHAAMALRRLQLSPRAPARIALLLDLAKMEDWFPVLAGLDETLVIWDAALPFFGDATRLDAWARLLLETRERWRGIFAHNSSGDAAPSGTPAFPDTFGSVTWLRHAPAA